MTLVIKVMLPGQEDQVTEISQSPAMIGSLLSGQLVLAADGVEPIHALLEQADDGEWLISDLGSASGIRLNGHSVDVEAKLAHGDRVDIGAACLAVLPPEAIESKGPPPPPPSPPPFAASRKHAAPGARPGVAKRKKEGRALPLRAKSAEKDLLFSSRDANQDGDVLEVVAYWDNTILEVEHFHPSYKDYERVTLGDSPEAHFQAGGEAAVSLHEFARFRDGGYQLSLLPGMTARLRRGGHVEKVDGGVHQLAIRDISQVRYGPVSFFFLFVKPPVVDLPPKRIDDPVFAGIMACAFAFFVAFIGVMLAFDPGEEEDLSNDIWSIVHVPEKARKPEKIVEPKVDLAKVKTEPPPGEEPPKPQPKAVAATTPEEKAKPVEKEKKTETSEAKSASMVDNLKNSASQPPVAVANQQKSQSGPETNAAGNHASGGLRKGKGKSDYKGVEGAVNQKSSGLNLGKLGLGVGRVTSAKGAGAVYTRFRNSAGGAGGGSGSGQKTFGLGGVGSSVKSLGLAGSGDALNQFGSGSGGFTGSAKGSTFGSGFGGDRGQTRVNVTAGDPLVSGGLTQEETMGVIRAGLNQIRHCYEKLLQRSPASSGKIKVKFSIGLNGRVSRADIVSSTISDSTMKTCVTSVVKRWKFPPPRGSSAVTVNYPFIFNPL